MTAANAAAPRRAILGSIGRIVVFALIFVASLAATVALLEPAFRGLVVMSAGRLRFDPLFELIAAVVATSIMIRAIDRRGWRDIGLSRPAARAEVVAQGWGLGALPIVGVCVALLATGWMRIVPAAHGSWIAAALRISVVLVPAALAEEIVCRGYLLTALRDSVGAMRAVVATSLLFGLLHIANAGATVESVLVVTLAGLFLAAVRVVCDSLYASWSAHLAWNWVMAVPFHAPVSGVRFEAPDYRAISTGPAWITGGSWGPEGGVAAALGMVGGLTYLYARRRREES